MRKIILKRFAFLITVTLFSFSFFYAFAEEGTLTLCGMTNNPDAHWVVSNPICPTHNVVCQEWNKDPSGQTGGPYYEYCCSICYFPAIQPE